MRASWFFFFVFAISLQAQTLTLNRTISLPNVKGRIDHFAIDSGSRLFVAALGNDTVEVVDLKLNKVTHSIRGLSEPQGLFYLRESGRLYVANGGDGTLRIYDGTSFASVSVLKFDDDADNVRYDADTKQLYVGHGSGALGVVDVEKNAIAGDIRLGAHPESFQLEPGGSRIFVNVPTAHEIAIVNRKTKTSQGKWSLGLVGSNFPMALDSEHHRAFVGCRLPARLLIFDTDTGKQTDKLDLHGDCDDVFYDSARHLVYASCGEGFIDVFAANNSDVYRLKETTKTLGKARTCYFDGDHLYLAVPRRGNDDAEIRIYDVKS